VHLLGTVDFESCLFLQERLVYEISGRNDSQGALLVCEHPPLITIGREGSAAHLLCEPKELAARQLDVRWLNRGGGCLVHVPGQLALYPILPLDRLQLGLSRLRQALEQTVVGSCRELRIPAETHADEPGVWGRSGQLAHIGLAIKSWVSYHGLFVNVCPAMDWLRLVQTGPRPGRLSCLAAERVRPVTMSAVRESLIRNLAAQCGYGRYHLYTGHPLLRRTRRICVYA
jgi:lipoyl(octanoyl) transferase